MGTTNALPKTAIEAFDAFLNNFVQGKSYVLSTEQSNLFSKESLEATYTEYCSKSQDKGKDRKFDDVINAMMESNDGRLETMIDIINHAVWLWALPNSRKAPWVHYSKQEETKNRVKDDLMRIKGVAGGGSGYVQYKTNGVRYILYLFSIGFFKMIDFEESYFKIVKKALLSSEKNKYDKNKFDVPDGVYNLLMHLCCRNGYEPIAATDDKKRIVKALWRLRSEYDKNKIENEEKAFEDLDDSLSKIRNKLSNGNEKFSFYENSFPLLWKGENTTALSLVQKLEYKKAMILFGPPGTGKTYSAMELAKEIIVRYYMKKYKEASKDNNESERALNECLEVLKNIEKKKKEHISYLQFHINYNYEDFIAGQVVDKNMGIKTKKGFIFDVIRKANDDPEIPYVVILDEINRTDISRVFGELFTAIEKRGEDVTLSLPLPNTSGRLCINIPENIYFIGTMNEIDFSLERVDFALRRRFIWELKDYSEDDLESIINYRLDKAVQENRIASYESEVDFDGFYNSCTNLNKRVKDEMGEAYHIGHAFFAEIADLFIELKKNGVNKPWEIAKKVLWQISIKPTLEAYCGTMEKEKKRKLLEKPKKGSANVGSFYSAFFTNDELNTM